MEVKVLRRGVGSQMQRSPDKCDNDQAASTSPGAPLPVDHVIAEPALVPKGDASAPGVFAPGHLGELTQIVPFEMVDAALASTGALQRHTRDLPSRVVVYVLLAGALFAECGYRQVRSRLVAGLDRSVVGRVARPSAAALAAARRRIGPAPLRALVDLLTTPAAAPGTKGTWWRGRLVCAIDGTMMCCPDTPANLTRRPSRWYRVPDDPAPGTGGVRHPNPACRDIRADQPR